MKGAHIRISSGSCRLTLNLPTFFHDTPLTKIRKALALMMDNPWENREAIETLAMYIDEWLGELKRISEDAEGVAQRYEASVREQESLIARFGTVATKEMKKRLSDERRRHKTAIRRAKDCRAALAKGDKIKKHYQSITE